MTLNVIGSVCQPSLYTPVGVKSLPVEWGQRAVFDLVHRAAQGQAALIFMARAFVAKRAFFLANRGPNPSLLSGAATHKHAHSLDNDYSIFTCTQII